MKNKIVSGILLCIAAIVSLSVCSNAFAICLQDNIGNVWCPKYPNGGITKNSIGDVVCGRGDCRVDATGNPQCSKATGGGADFDAMGNVVCVGGCESATKEQCVQAQK